MILATILATILIRNPMMEPIVRMIRVGFTTLTIDIETEILSKT